LRTLALQLLWWTGASRLAYAVLARRGRFVIELHGVASRRVDELPRDAQPSFTRAELAALLDWLRPRFPFLTPEELLDGDAPGVLLTFDDGYANHVDVVLPLLEEYRASAVFFVTTRHVLDPGNWLPAVRARRLGPLPPELRRDLFDGMSAEQLRAAAASPLVTIGSHTVSHPFLTRLEDDELARELADSKRFLEDATGDAVDLFAYPTGDYDRRTIAAVRDAGYRAAFVERSRGLGGGRWEIPRVGLYSAVPAYLSAKLSGLFAGRIWRRHLAG
jgi:peptidoglycan/xylan/chitin deacetylase (PgdA/CDA1 family)